MPAGDCSAGDGDEQERKYAARQSKFLIKESPAAIGVLHEEPGLLKFFGYSGYRFPADVIQRAVWLYLLFTLSYRDVEELLAERGLEASYETIRQWVHTFGPAGARRLRAGRPRPQNHVRCAHPRLSLPFLPAQVLPTSARATIRRMISLVPSRI
jgi:hypothetical protein